MTYSTDEIEQPVIVDACNVSADDIWEFLENSGFIYPQKRQIIDTDAAKATLKKLISCENDVFKSLLVMRGSSIYAHISAVRLFDKTWMVQHMASMPYKKEKVSHALMLNLAMLNYFKQSSNVEWIRATYRHENKRVSRLYEALAAQVTNLDLSIISYLNCMRFSGNVFEIPSSSDLEIKRLSDNSGTVGDNITNNYRKIGLERRPEIFGAYRSNKLVGYSCLEVSSPGLNLSELTNSFRVFMRNEDDDALSSLIQTSVNYYISLGQQSVIALVDDNLVSKFEALGFACFKRYTFWTWHQSLCGQFYDFISKWQ